MLAICPINPFFWPVKASLGKALVHSLTGKYEKSHYRSIYFHKSGPTVDAAFEKYLTEMASGIDRYRNSRRVFPVLVAMEMLDREACERLGEKLGGAPIFSSDKLDMHEMVSILRQCDRMLSSRFHAIVTSMPAGVPSAGVTMDERIRNLMRDRGHGHLLMRVDEPDLGDKIFVALRSLDAGADEIRDSMGADRRAQSAADGAHGRLFRGAGGAAVSGISGAHGRAGVGRVSAAAELRAATIARAA